MNRLAVSHTQAESRSSFKHNLMFITFKQFSMKSSSSNRTFVSLLGDMVSGRAMKASYWINRGVCSPPALHPASPWSRADWISAVLAIWLTYERSVVMTASSSFILVGAIQTSTYILRYDPLALSIIWSQHSTAQEFRWVMLWLDSCTSVIFTIHTLRIFVRIHTFTIVPPYPILTYNAWPKIATRSIQNLTPSLLSLIQVTPSSLTLPHLASWVGKWWE